VEFNGNINLDLVRGETISVCYQKNNPSDAKMNSPICIWGDTMAYLLLPFLFLLVVFLKPDIIPKKSKVLLGKKPFIGIL
jgi:hypothetical protein